MGRVNKVVSDRLGRKSQLKIDALPQTDIKLPCIQTVSLPIFLRSWRTPPCRASPVQSWRSLWRTIAARPATATWNWRYKTCRNNQTTSTHTSIHNANQTEQQTIVALNDAINRSNSDKHYCNFGRSMNAVLKLCYHADTCTFSILNGVIIKTTHNIAPINF